MKKVRFAGCATSLIYLFLGTSGLLADGTNNGAPGVATVAPEITCRTLSERKSLTLKKLQGRVVILDFWAAWSPNCRKSIPYLIEIRRKYPEDELALIGITKGTSAQIDPFIKKMKVNYTIGFDDLYGKTTSLYKVTNFPQTFIIDAGGVIRWSGNPLEKGKEFEEHIEQYVREVRLAIRETHKKRLADMAEGRENPNEGLTITYQITFSRTPKTHSETITFDGTGKGQFTILNENITPPETKTTGFMMGNQDNPARKQVINILSTLVQNNLLDLTSIEPVKTLTDCARAQIKLTLDNREYACIFPSTLARAIPDEEKELKLLQKIELRLHGLVQSVKEWMKKE